MEMKDRLKNIGINIKSERLRRGISQEELAEKCDISRNSVSLIETGKINPTIIRVIDIADALVHCCPEHNIILRDVAAALSEIFCDLLPIEREQRFIALLYKTSRHIAACLS